MRKQRYIAQLTIMTLALVGLISSGMLMPTRPVRAQTIGGTWAGTGSLNVSRNGHTATLLPNGKVLAAGGVNNNLGSGPIIYTTMNSAELYDPATGGWSYTGNLMNPRELHTATLLRNGQVLVAGGLDVERYVSSIAYLKSAELFDPATGQWHPTGSLNTITGHSYAALLADGKVLAVGTSSHGAPNPIYSAELYDPATGTWTSTTAPLSFLGTSFPGSLTLLASGKVLGLDGDTAAELYDPATGTWSSTGSLNVIRIVNTATLLHNGNVLVTGWTGSSPSAELYDPNTRTWRVTGNPSITGKATLLSDGRVLLTGNYDAYESPTPGSGEEVYDPATGRWSQTSLHSPPRSSFTATLLSDGRVLAAGGSDYGYDFGEVIFNNAELYTPAATPGPNTVQFNSSAYTVSEGSPRVDLTLSRSGDTTAAATVSLSTSDTAGLQNCNVINGIASPRCDYENTIGTVSFAAGETAKSFSVAIIDDSYAEGNETFTVSLNNGSGTTIGTQSTATVTLIDNDGSNGPNPIDSTNFFVRQQYIDFLGREPDPPGFNGWVSSINNCSGDTTQCDRIHVSQLFFQSEEFQSRGYFVYRFYPVTLGRKPDYAEFVPDLARVSGFLDATQLEAAKIAFIADFMTRPAFGSQYNSLSNTAYVDALINTSAVNLPNRQALIDSLNNNTATRAQVLRHIVESSAVSTKYNHQAFAVMEYFGYLRRDPDALYLNWIAVLDATNDPRGMVTGFATSPEYRLRFGP